MIVSFWAFALVHKTKQVLLAVLAIFALLVVAVVLAMVLVLAVVLAIFV